MSSAPPLKDNRREPLSLDRLIAVIIKEFTQLRRDRLTLGMLIGIPLMQLIMFGYAINGDPKHLPTALVVHEHTTYTRSLTRALLKADGVTPEDNLETALSSRCLAEDAVGADGTASRRIDLPQGGFSVVIGNLLQQGPLTGNEHMLGYSCESNNDWPDQRLWVVNNTFVSEYTLRRVYDVECVRHAQ